MKMSDQTGELFASLAKASVEIKVAVFDKKSHHGPYASFKSVREASVEALNKHGLSITQPVSFDGQHYDLFTILGHTTGQWIQSSIRLILDKNNMQSLGSAITYAKRYGWSAIVGIVSDDDDDGNAASKPADPPKNFTRLPSPSARASGPPPPNSAASAEQKEMIDSLASERGIHENIIHDLIRNGYGTTILRNWVADEIIKLLEIEDCSEDIVRTQTKIVAKRREDAAQAKAGK